MTGMTGNHCCDLHSSSSSKKTMIELPERGTFCGLMNPSWISSLTPHPGQSVAANTEVVPVLQKTAFRCVGLVNFRLQPLTGHALCCSHF